MNRTYNFQVDNGLFVAENMLQKNYKDIIVDDLRNNIDLFSDRINLYKEKNYAVVSMTFYNSYLTQKGKNIKDQLELLLDNIGNDLNCAICGKKRVRLDEVDTITKSGSVSKKYMPYSSLFYSVPSHNNFMNRGNYLKSVDVCPVCLFLSVLSILNTQKMGNALLYMSDNDDFMRSITKDIHSIIDKDILLDNEKIGLDKKFVQTMQDLRVDKMIYDDMNYVELVRYNNNPQNPSMHKLTLNNEKLDTINKVKHAGLIDEFYKLYLFNSIGKDVNLIKVLSSRAKKNKVCSQELYDILKEDYMTKKELQLVESMTQKLMDIDGKKALSSLNLIKGKADFIKFLKDYSNKVDLCETLEGYNEVIENSYTYRDYLILNLKLKGVK